MNDETTHRTFFSLAVFSPLALLGLRKKESVPYPISSRIPTDKEIEQARRWFRLVKNNGKENDRLRERAETAEKELQALRKETA